MFMANSHSHEPALAIASEGHTGHFGSSDCRCSSPTHHKPMNTFGFGAWCEKLGPISVRGHVPLSGCVHCMGDSHCLRTRQVFWESHCLRHPTIKADKSSAPGCLHGIALSAPSMRAHKLFGPQYGLALSAYSIVSAVRFQQFGTLQGVVLSVITGLCR